MILSLWHIRSVARQWKKTLAIALAYLNDYPNVVYRLCGTTRALACHGPVDGGQHPSNILFFYFMGSCIFDCGCHIFWYFWTASNAFCFLSAGMLRLHFLFHGLLYFRPR